MECSNVKQNRTEPNHKTFAASTADAVGAVVGTRDIALGAASRPLGPVVPNAVAGPLVASIHVDGAELNDASDRRRQRGTWTRLVPQAAC